MLVECSNCGAPLEVVDDAAVVTCTYCQRANQVRSRPAVAQQRRQGARGARPLILVAGLVGVGGVAVAATIPLLSRLDSSTSVTTPALSATSDPAPAVVPSPGSIGGQGAADPAPGDDARPEQPKPSPAATERAPDGEGDGSGSAARRAAKRARRAQVRRARAQTRREAEAEPLPASPDRAAVVRALRGLDLSTCEGHGTVTYGIRVEPSGETDTTSVGPMRTSGPVLGCVRGAIESLRFPPSREGLELRHEFVVPE